MCGGILWDLFIFLRQKITLSAMEKAFSTFSIDIKVGMDLSGYEFIL